MHSRFEYRNRTKERAISTYFASVWHWRWMTCVILSYFDSPSRSLRSLPVCLRTQQRRYNYDDFFRFYFTYQTYIITSSRDSRHHINRLHKNRVLICYAISQSEPLSTRSMASIQSMLFCDNCT